MMECVNSKATDQGMMECVNSKATDQDKPRTQHKLTTEDLQQEKA